MQAAPAAAAAALTALSVLLTLDCLSAHRPPNNQIQQQTDETAQKKKNQPHIVFILTDDQVCVRVMRVRFLESKCLDSATETRKHIIVFT